MPTTQLHVAPIEPRAPPPSRWNVWSIGAMVWPLAVAHATPRQTSSPPRVTMNEGMRPKATRKPANAPMTAPRRSPPARVTIQVSGWSNPHRAGSHSAWASAMAMPTTASTDPTDRSMLRVTMTSTIPVAMIPTEAVCTDRFHRFRAVRNVPPDRMWNPTQMTASATSIPSSRVSTSVARSNEPAERISRGSSTSLIGPLSASAIASHPARRDGAPRPRGHRGRGASSGSVQIVAVTRRPTPTPRSLPGRPPRR